MRKLSKKMMISLMTFALVFIALGASTYAWFTLADSAELTNLEINVTGGGGLEMALTKKDGTLTDYNTNLSSSIISDVLGKIQLSDVTSIDGTTFKNFEGETISYDKTGKINSFIELTINFNARVEEVSNPSEVAVYLVNKQTPTYAENLATQGTFVISEGVTTKTSHSYTSNDGEVKPTDNAKTYYAADAIMVSFADAKQEKVKLFDFNAADGRNYNDGFNADATQLKGAASFQYNENGTNPGVGEERDSTKLEEISALSTFTDGSIADNDNSKVCILTKQNDGTYTGSVTIRIWVEGFDYDCFNVIYSDTILTQFEFKLGYKE